MLRNFLYVGRIVVPEWKKELLEIVDGLHSRIVSEEIFEKVASILSDKKRKSLITNLNDEMLPLRQQLLCSKCDKKFTGAPSKGNGGKFYYYHCRNRCNGS